MSSAEAFNQLVWDLHHELRTPASLTEAEKELKSELGENLFHWLILETDMEIVRKLAEIGIPFDEPNDFEQTPLFECSIVGFLDRMQYLLELGADPNRKSKYGEGMLSYALSHDRKDVVELLAKYGAKPDEEMDGDAD